MDNFTWGESIMWIVIIIILAGLLSPSTPKNNDK